MPPAAAIAGAAIVGAGASIVGGNKAANAQKDAASQAAAAQERATQLQIEEARRQYDLTRADYAPYRQVGYGALDKLASMYGVTKTGADGKPIAGAAPAAMTDGGFTASPGYQFRLNEGIKAAERSAAARGSLASGGTMKAIQRYGEGLAASEYDAFANRLASLAGVGQSATGSTAAAGQAASGAIGGAIGANGAAQAGAAMAAGNARASSYANTASSINSGINNLASLYLYNQGGGFGGTTYGGTPPIYGGKLGGIY